MSGHIPYRNWCPVCVRAKGKEMGHMRGEENERGLPEYSWDYCFPGDEMGYKWVVLVGRERGSKGWMATTVPMKGGTGMFAIDKCMEFVEELGDKEGTIIIKTDQENSIEYMVKGIVEARGEGKTIVEESPVNSHESNGVVERAVQEIEGGIRAVYLGLEERLGIKVDARERIVAFLPEYVTYLMNRLKEGEDGKTVLERIRGKKPTVVGLEF